MHTNRLARKKSPYLLQHAHNPVDWFAWNDEAFTKARVENKPVFLSIGYSTCHWCHVMERESFEQEAIGKFLNEHFVSIKVDREERPDVDKIYMTFVQSHDRRRRLAVECFSHARLEAIFRRHLFSAGRALRPAKFFCNCFEQIAGLWRERKNEIVASADEIHTRLETATANSSGTDSSLTTGVLKNAIEVFKSGYDPIHGGFRRRSEISTAFDSFARFYGRQKDLATMKP